MFEDDQFLEDNGLTREELVGAAALIITDWMTSECSESSVMNMEEWKTYRFEHGGGDTGLEVRRKAWRSKKVCVSKIPMMISLTVCLV